MKSTIKEFSLKVKGLNFEDSRTAARVESHDLLLDDFKKFILEQYKGSGRDGEDVPDVVISMGHRWAAAFPVGESRGDYSVLYCIVMY